MTLSSDYEPMVLSRDDEGQVSADKFPDQLLIDEALLHSASCVGFVFDGRSLTFSLANGSAVYRQVERFGDGRVGMQRVDQKASGA